MIKKSLVKKQMLLYLGILLITFGAFGFGVATVYTKNYMEEQEQLYLRKNFIGILIQKNLIE